MTREIKFRAWDGSRFYSPILSDGKVFRDYRDFEDNIHCDDQVMQFTGLKDKNNKEVYEGDICVNSNGRMAKVIFHEPSASFDFIALNDIGDNYGYAPQMVKYKIAVIGNIYQNPELLESE